MSVTKPTRKAAQSASESPPASRIKEPVQDVLTTSTGVKKPSLPAHAPLRLLHVVVYFGKGAGTEHIVSTLIKGLSGDIFEHRVCILRALDPDPETLQLLGNNFSVVGRRDERFQFLVFRLARIMRAYRPHIVHSRNWGAIESVLAGRLARVPVVIHSEHGYSMDMLDGMPLRRRLMRRALYGMTTGLLTVTRELRDFHARQAWVSPQRFRVIYNGVDTQRFSPRPEVRLRLKAELGLPPKSFVIGNVGRMVPIKDQRTLLKAAEVVIGRGIDLSVVLVGWGPELAALRGYAETSAQLAGRVSFVGRFGDVPGALNALDAYVLPSLREGMSNTLLEALASGLPVVATRVGGNPEVVEENRSGWLFSPGDVLGLSEHLQRLAGHPGLCRQFGNAARLRATERFGLNRMLQDYRNLYLELAGRPRL